LLHPDVLEEPYDFYRTLRDHAPVWAVPGTDVVTVATFELISEAVGRPEDFSSNILSLLYRDDGGLPARLDFGGTAPPTLATACTRPIGRPYFPNWWPAACPPWTTCNGARNPEWGASMRAASRTPVRQ
jgi:hypothetical protein